VIFFRVFALVLMVACVAIAMDHLAPTHTHPKWHAIEFGFYAGLAAAMLAVTWKD
jgi:hypothetical protein